MRWYRMSSPSAMPPSAVRSSAEPDSIGNRNTICGEKDLASSRTERCIARDVLSVAEMLMSVRAGHILREMFFNSTELPDCHR